MKTTDENEDWKMNESSNMPPCTIGQCCKHCHHWEPIQTRLSGYCPIFNKIKQDHEGKNCTAFQENFYE